MHFLSERPDNFARFNGGNFCLCIIDVQSACASVKTTEDGCMIRKWRIKVIRSRNKIVEPELLPKKERTKLFFYPENPENT